MRHALLALALVGCSLGEHPNGCDDDADCAGSSPMMCYRPVASARGYCVLIDAGGGSDGGRDGGMPDAGGCRQGRPCYTGPELTRGTGRCVDGVTECRDGADFCVGEITPAANDLTCDGEDDDCDGMEDEDIGLGMECAIAQPGVCAEGAVQCVDARYSCRPVVEASAETCDLEDEDCDGAVDEDTDIRCYPPEAPRGCDIQPDGSFDCTGICFSGLLSCAMGLATCVGAIMPTLEEFDTCSAGEPVFDDDCDGLIDEECATACTDGAMRDCYTGPEAAAGVGICTIGTQTCAGTTWGACTGSVEPGEESCANPGADDDCDGSVDDIEGQGDACIDDAALGVCRMGVFECDAGALVCTTPEAATEICNSVDDDCDGMVNEGFDPMTDEQHCGGCGRSCGPMQTCCGGLCFDTNSEALHCGMCGNDCAETEGCCGGACMDTESDPMNCGACGNVCPGTQGCCDGVCADTRSDGENCGMCGTACTGGDICCDGVCADDQDPACTECDTACGDDVCCAPSCVDTDTDPAHCGDCATTCAMGQSCCGGDCADTSLDEMNCGACGTTCSGANDTCCGAGCVNVDVDARHCGMCGNACDPGDICCGGTCVDPTSDAMHCGDCTTDCSTLSFICSNSECCRPGNTYCAGSMNCVDLQTDINNCGMCGRRCAATQTCCSGACVDTRTDEMNCGMCGTRCTGATGTCCASACVNVDTSTSHCGMCGAACGAGQSCCGTYCANLNNDEANCGSCGNGCGFLQLCCSRSCGGLC